MFVQSFFFQGFRLSLRGVELERAPRASRQEEREEEEEEEEEEERASERPRFPVRGEREGEVESGRSTLKISRLESASWPFSESPKPLETRALRRGSPTAVGPRACRVPLERRGDEIEERRMAEKGGESKQHLSCSAFSHEHAIDFFFLPFSFFSFQLPEQVNNQSPLT